MLQVYGSKISYFTGKLEAYLRYKGIPYRRVVPHKHRAAILENAGALQLPVIKRDDGRWMSDTTPILQALETEHPDPPIMPPNPAVRFIALLLEDYADEWLWRSAMHYRWSYAHDRGLLSSIITDEILVDLPLPRFAKRLLIKTRQRVGFVIRDGVSAATRDHVEGGYLAALDNLSSMLEGRPFLLGNAPSVADFGFMGPMLRHFGQDPTPAEIMRERAPSVYAWVSRVWGAGKAGEEPRFLDEIPADCQAMLREVCETHLEQLNANAAAFAGQKKRFSLNVQGCHYPSLPVSRYRVACLERLREGFEELKPDHQARVRALLPFQQADILWSPDSPAASGYDEERTAPFNKAINVYRKGVPR
ncbi:MAG: glutathione S-transferase N-terminal domain-containing protein [Myxococcota bacterium]|nr:glutathione S-transferase N-terminal domain-containing protein [Myxococcota bacterium]